MKRKKILAAIIAVLLLVVLFFGWKILGPSVSVPEGKYFYIKTGSNYSTVKQGLTDAKIITSPGLFDFMAKRLKYTDAVKAGRYEIKPGMSLLNLIRMLRSGNQSPVNFTIKKIRTVENLASMAGRAFECDSADMMRFLSNADSLAGMNVDSNTLMTAVLPNTYSILWNSSPSKIFRKLYNEQVKFWTPERKQKANGLNLSPTQAYTLASIVEEETNVAEDKGKIASVYLNRMETGMKLGADPTVKFAMRDFGLKRILNKHLEFASPYNTYLHPGLPPGPICTPSAETIDAVLNAPSTSYLYFVAQPNLTGYSNFAVDYSQHMQYAHIYQQWIDSFLRARAAKPPTDKQ
jgi:UPF0755 protein